MDKKGGARMEHKFDEKGLFCLFCGADETWAFSPCPHRAEMEKEEKENDKES
jgi:hypothetical protein